MFLCEKGVIVCAYIAIAPNRKLFRVSYNNNKQNGIVVELFHRPSGLSCMFVVVVFFVFVLFVFCLFVFSLVCLFCYTVFVCVFVSNFVSVSLLFLLPLKRLQVNSML